LYNREEEGSEYVHMAEKMKMKPKISKKKSRTSYDLMKKNVVQRRRKQWEKNVVGEEMLL